MAAPHKQTIIATLTSQENALRDLGVRSLYLFGSVARNAAHANSDIDLFFDYDRTQPFSLIDLVQLQDRLTELLQHNVDLMTRDSIHPRLKDRILASSDRIF